tara:strand:+ start:225 stop:659 length:435 start_codon:yes stop_codon:yes gene_type:complete
MLDSFFNAIFGSVIESSPVGGIILISFILTLLITVAYKYFTDQEVLKSLKQEMKEMRKEMKEFKDDPKKMMELQKKSMQKSMEQMKMTFKPMLITLLPLLVVFSWLRATYTDLGDVFLGLSWIWTYIIFSIVFSMTLRKILKVH